MRVAVCVHRYRRSNPRYRAAAPLIEACARRGLTVDVIAGAWHGPVPDGVDTATMPALLGGRRAGARAYRRWAAGVLRRRRPDCAVGFDPVPGLDFYCGERHEAHAGAVGMDGTVVSAPDLPPGLTPHPPRAEARDVRAMLGFGGGDMVLAMFGGDLAARGFERVLAAVSRLPEASRRRVRLLAAGDLAPAFLKAVRVLGLDGQVRLGDVDPAEALAAADLLVDLPYRAGSNALVFDALAAGVPVLTAQDVAESALVAEADAGLVLASPLVQAECGAALGRIAAAAMAGAPEWRRWRDRGRGFAAEPRHRGQIDRLLALIDGHLEAVSLRAPQGRPGAAGAPGAGIVAYDAAPRRGGRGDAPVRA